MTGMRGYNLSSYSQSSSAKGGTKLSWRFLFKRFELAIEMCQVAVAYLVGNQGDRLFGIHQQGAGVADAELCDVVSDGHVGLLLERAMQRAAAERGGPHEFGYVDLIPVMRMQVGDDAADAFFGRGWVAGRLAGAGSETRCAVVVSEYQEHSQQRE